ncbi:MAG: L,D-transpeptidase [Candidatus Dormiibacterota bacterium]
MDISRDPDNSVAARPPLIGRSRAWLRRAPRRRRLLLGTAVVLVAIAVDLPLAYLSSNHLQQERTALRVTWNRDQRAGVTPAALSKLRRDLAQDGGQPWWSPAFWAGSQQSTLAHLQSSTTAVWAKALDQGRQSALGYLTKYATFARQNAAWLSADQVSQDEHWKSQLTRAATPGRLQGLTLLWKTDLDRAQQSVKAAQAAAAAALVAANGTSGLLGQATALESSARDDGISELAVPADATLLQQALASGKSGLAQSSALSQQLAALRSEIGLDQQVENLNESVLGLVDQAAFEQVPGYAGFQSQFQTAESTLKAAQTGAQLSASQAPLQTIEQSVLPALAADTCGHTSIAGKAIYISLSLQEMIFYDNGCVANATPVTTGRPGEETPTGTFSVYLKASPLEFTSGYAPGSPNYYTPFLASYAMEFLTGGYYIHNAPWEPADAFGPGSQDNLADASHGCVHTPLAALAWAYSWTPDGTPVVISA